MSSTVRNTTINHFNPKLLQKQATNSGKQEVSQKFKLRIVIHEVFSSFSEFTNKYPVSCHETRFSTTWQTTRVDEAFQSLGKHKPNCFVKLDMTSGYNKNSLDPDSQENTAFITYLGFLNGYVCLLVYKEPPALSKGFGYHCAPRFTLQNTSSIC